MIRDEPARPDDEPDVGRRRFLASTSLWPIGALALPLVACGTDAGGREVGYRLDTSMQSPNRDSRVRTLVLHYTAHTLPDSLASLINPGKRVSSHYLVPEVESGDTRPSAYVLVPESQRAWHAGVSFWHGERMLNASSIGIEIVNLGYPIEDESAPPMQRRWQPYADAQIALVGQLAADIVARHGIPPYRVVGHADVAPGRKWDPGPLFPWRRLYERYGVGAWPEPDAVAFFRGDRPPHQPHGGDIAELQRKLLAYGYDAPQTGMLDARTINVVTAFQMHFRPARYDGMPDIETVAILDALLDRYVPRAGVYTTSDRERI